MIAKIYYTAVFKDVDTGETEYKDKIKECETLKETLEFFDKVNVKRVGFKKTTEITEKDGIVEVSINHTPSKE